MPGLRPFNLAFPGDAGGGQGGTGGGGFDHPSGSAYAPGGFGDSVGAFTPSSGAGGLPGGADFGSGLPGSIGSGISGPGGFDIGLPGFLGNSGSTSAPVTPASSTSAPVTKTGLGSAIGDAVLSALGIKRLAIFLLGLICVIGAIYLYKPTQELVSGPIGAAKEGLKGAAAGLAAA